MKLKIVTKPFFGKAFDRINQAFYKYKPDWVTFVDKNEDASIVHVVGGEEIEPASKNNAIIIQHCYFTTNYDKWDELWEKALLTISFHDLTKYTDKKFNFLQTPWGADEDIFFRIKGKEKIPKTLFTTGHVKETECHEEIYKACVETDTIMFHTGADYKFPNRHIYRHLDYMSNTYYNNLLNTCTFTAGLRLLEGFEMHCVEGLFTETIPIIFDLPTYSYYKDFGIFVNPNKDIVNQLVNILSNYNLPKISFEKAKEKFNWKVIMKNIYNSIGEAYGNKRS